MIKTDLRLRDGLVLHPVGSPTTDPSNLYSLPIGWIGAHQVGVGPVAWLAGRRVAGSW